jgi:steroid 5-alpha reductase family enzyme
MSLVTSLLLAWLLAAIAQTLAFFWQRKRRNAGIVDVVWSFGVGGAAVLLAAVGSGAALPRVLLAVLGGAWGLRLGLHLWHRVRGEDEDGRYANMRRHWGNRDAKWFAFFQAQALLVALFALPFAAVAQNPVGDFNLFFAGAIAVWIASVAGEAVADRQLAAFRANPSNKGKVCDVGLWRYSRHPNYFFEWLHWFAYVLLAVGAPQWWLAWAGPVVMYVFLRWLSGIPHTEAQALRTRGEAYREYQRTTPMLFPWFPRSKA